MLGEHIVQVIKGYELREQIGEGGYGVVYRAYQPLVGRDVAVKIILPRYANHPDFIRRRSSPPRHTPAESDKRQQHEHDPKRAHQSSVP